jgi:integrase
VLTETAEARIDGRRRSPVCQPGYGRGRTPANAGKTYPAEVYSRSEIDGMMSELGRGYLGLRNRAVVVALWRCGLRIEEAIALAGYDVDLDARTLLVRHGKNNRQRMLGLDVDAAEFFSEWVEQRQARGFDPADPFFPVCYGPTAGKAIYSSVFRETLKLAAGRSGLRKRAHPHAFRHTFASENIRERTPLPVLSAMMGHLDVAYTFAYIRKVAPWEAIEAMQARSWPGAERRAPAPAGLW